jgi:predicted tellurium resistance membrane protein TerC
MELFTGAEAWVSLATLTILEIVLGIDNIIFISIQADRLPANQQAKGRRLGLILAMGTRVLLLLSITWLMKLTAPLFNLADVFHILDKEWVRRFEFSGRDLILLAGGLFLIYKSIAEIHHKMEGEEESTDTSKSNSFWGIVLQIAILDIVFSLDSVITAVGMAQHIEIMIAAVVIAVGVMMWASTPIANFVNKHVTVKMLALSFLLIIGFSLVLDAFDQEVPKGYIYFAMGFAILVELLNLRATRKRTAAKGGAPN